MNDESIIHTTETYCKSCGALSTEPDVCSYCGNNISAGSIEGTAVDHSSRGAKAEGKAVDRALSKIQNTITEGETIKFAFSNDFDFNRRARIRFLYPGVIVSMFILLLPLLSLLGWNQISPISFNNIYYLISLMVPVLVSILPTIPTLAFGLPIVDYVYVMTNLRFEVFGRRGRYVSTVWFNRIRTVVEVFSESKSLGNVGLYSFIGKTVKENSLVPKTRSFKGFVRRIRKSVGHINESQLSKRSIVSVNLEKVAEIETVINAVLKPNCQIYRFYVNSPHDDTSLSGF